LKRSTGSRLTIWRAIWKSLSVVRFTDLPKVGLNPVNEYNTPTGIYFYPHYELADFATDREYRIEGQLEGWCIDFNYLEPQHLEELLGRYSLTQEEVWAASEDWLEEGADESSIPWDKEPANTASLWWAATRLAAQNLREAKEREIRKRLRGTDSSYLPPRLQESWMKVIRSVCDFVFDPGFGIIHTHEPTQALSFAASTLKKPSVESNKKKKKQEPWDYMVFFDEIAATTPEGAPRSQIDMLVVDAEQPRKTQRIEDVLNTEQVLLPGIRLEGFKRKTRNGLYLLFFLYTPDPTDPGERIRKVRIRSRTRNSPMADHIFLKAKSTKKWVDVDWWKDERG
jgi:hypothetical protein